MLLNIKDLHVSYGKINVISNLSLKVNAGETVSLVGPNGAGKSTLFKAISGLIPSSKGHICFDGQEITGLPAHQIVRVGLGQVPEGRQIFTKLTIKDNLLLAAHYGNPNRKDYNELYQQAFRLFPVLQEKARLKAGMLSGGQQQMLAIAKALMIEPKLLLLDEPSLGLAPLIVREIFEIIKQLNLNGITVLLIEQNAYAALRISHRAYILENGQVRKEGNAALLLKDPEIREHYLGVGIINSTPKEKKLKEVL